MSARRTHKGARAAAPVVDHLGDAGGFTLLEVMVALAILASTLVVLLQIITNNVRATNHAKLTTAATLLARAKMTDIEDGVLENGFSTDNETAKGTFKDQGFADFSWDSVIERIELPTDMKQLAEQKTSDDSKSKDPMQALTGMMGGLMSTFMEPIRIGLEESVRRVTLTITWNEIGRHDQTLQIVTFLTDSAKLDLALSMGAAGSATGAGAGAAGRAAAAGTGTGK
jgi:prepilin-type N-terminal cleavage/methylation domain-containing protein